MLVYYAIIPLFLEKIKQGSNGSYRTQAHCCNLKSAVFFILLPVFRLHIHDIILLKIETGRIKNFLFPEVMHINLPFVTLLTNYSYTVNTGLRRQVTCLCNRLQQGNTVTFH